MVWKLCVSLGVGVLGVFGVVVVVGVSLSIGGLDGLGAGRMRYTGLNVMVESGASIVFAVRISSSATALSQVSLMVVAMRRRSESPVFLGSAMFDRCGGLNRR